MRKALYICQHNKIAQKGNEVNYKGVIRTAGRF
jgi:hypothetical protein